MFLIRFINRLYILRYRIFKIIKKWIRIINNSMNDLELYIKKILKPNYYVINNLIT